MLEENRRIQDLLVYHVDDRLYPLCWQWFLEAVEALSQLLDRTDQCSSWHEIWMLKLRGKSFGQYFLRIYKYHWEGYTYGYEMGTIED